MTDASAGPAASRAAADAAARKRTERTLIFIVVFLGLLMVAGIVAVVLRVIYLSSQPATQQVSAAAGSEASAEGVSLALPAGAVVKSVSLAGDRMAVHYEAPGGAGIAVVDLATGAVVRRVKVVPGGARP